MLAALTSIAALYYLFILVLKRGWKMAMQPPEASSSVDHPTVTVVIAARNEASNIANLLNDLEHQTMPNFEVVVVDDHSDDDTAAIARTFSGNSRYALEVVCLESTAGKKAAVTTGVYRAHGSIIITTDADCRLGPRWIEGMVASFEPNVKFVSGGVRIGRTDTFSAQLQAAEFASLIGVGASAIGLGHPILCNGANMAFRRDAFLKVGGYSGNDHIASGDDVFLLQKIHRHYPGSVVFCRNSDAVVETRAVPWRQFFSQRIRWGAKWKHAGSLAMRALALFIGCIHLSWLILVPALIVSGVVVEPVTLLLIKALLEMLYLRRVHRFTGVKWSWRIFFLLQLSYSAYIVAVGTLANFKTTDWKGRKIGRTPVEIHSRLADNR
jgi:biofilm PGA synthesis N-glycosyltransferase PgaC